MIVKRVVGLRIRIGGESHSGWLPPNAAQPLPTPTRDVDIDVEIQADPSGYLLCYAARDGSFAWDNWYESLAEAERAAESQFGITPGQWISG